MTNQCYPVADYIPMADRNALGVDSRATVAELLLRTPHPKLNVPSLRIMAVFTGEKRRPKKGEWYLSGAVVEAYRAPNDLPTEFHIAKLVLVEEQLILKRTLLASSPPTQEPVTEEAEHGT